jgi:hypothetical protein
MKDIFNKLNAFTLAFFFESFFSVSGSFTRNIPFYEFISHYFITSNDTVVPTEPVESNVTKLINLATKIVESHFCPYRKILDIIGKQDLQEVNRLWDNIRDFFKSIGKGAKNCIHAY